MACAHMSVSVLSGHCLGLLAAHGRLHTKEHMWETTIQENMMHMSGVQTSLLLQMPCRIQIEPANWVEAAYDHFQHRTSSTPSMILGGRQSLQAGNVAWYNSMPVASGLWPGKKGAVASKSSQNKGEVASGGQTLWGLECIG